MIKILDHYNKCNIDRQCFECSMNYWIAQGYKVITVEVLPKEDKIMAVLDNGKND